MDICMYINTFMVSEFCDINHSSKRKKQNIPCIPLFFVTNNPQQNRNSLEA